MTCPHRSSGADPEPSGSLSSSEDDPESTRRAFLRSAVAVGGASAMAACAAVERDDGATATPSVPQGPEDPSSLPERQHAWGEYLVRDRFGNTTLPQHQAMVLLRYVGDGPTAAERDAVEGAFRTLERAFQRGTGGNHQAVAHEGLLFAVGYAPRWFDRFDADLPEALDLPHPGAMIDELDGDAEPDDYDAIVHMGSGLASVLLAAERALLGEVDRVNGVAVEGDLTGAFEVAERRTGFVGQGQPAEKYDADAIPESAPLSMGFRSGLSDNLATEDAVTIQSGPFAGGTTMQVSQLTHDLDAWYDRPKAERVELMFSPHHAPEDVGDVGEQLADESGIEEGHVEDLSAVADEHGVVGHGQKLAAARDEDFDPTILRRDFDANGEPGLHFDSWQRGVGEFVDVRTAMDGDDLDVDPHQNGILEFVDVETRATYLMPPRSKRALPGPRP
jgi:hypothetical protein